MDPEERQEQLLLHIAKGMLDSGPKLQERLLGSVTTVSGVFLSAYMVALGFLRPPPTLLVLMPPTLWILSLVASIVLLFPQERSFDLKNLRGIADFHTYASAKQTRVLATQTALAIVGVVMAFCVIFFALAGQGSTRNSASTSGITSEATVTK